MRVENTFGIGDVNEQKQNDFIDKIHVLEKLMIQETKFWWDSITLQKYVDKYMITQGLRIKKIRTTVYSDSFKAEGNNILSNCSIQLINLIIKQEEEKLKQISEDIKNADLAIQQFKYIKDFD